MSIPPNKGAGGFAAIPLLSSLNRDQLQLIVPLLMERRYVPADIVFRRDDEGSDLFLIEQGKVALYRETVYGPQPLAELTGGSLFGELPLLDGGKRSATVEATAFTTIWQLSGVRLLSLFRREPALVFPFYRSFWKSLAYRLHLANKNLLRFFLSVPSGPGSSFQTSNAVLSEAAAQLFGDISEDSQIIDPRQLSVDPEQKYRAMKKIGLTDEEIHQLFRYGEEIGLPSGACIFHEGDHGESLYFILAGEVRISKQIPDIGEEVLAFLKHGEIFGEMALVNRQSRRTADCYAHEKPVLLLGFNRRTLNELQWNTESELPFLSALCKMMARRLREFEEKLYAWKMMSGGCD